MAYTNHILFYAEEREKKNDQIHLECSLDCNREFHNNQDKQNIYSNIYFLMEKKC